MLVAGTAVVAIGALTAWALRPAVVTVDAAVVQRGTLVVTVEDEGETRVRDRYVISAPVAGRVLRINLKAGDAVIANRTVVAAFAPADPAPLDSRSRAEAEARVNAATDATRTARADRDRIAADLDFARRDLARKRELFAGGAIALEQVEASERSVRVLEESVRSAEAASSGAAHQLDVARAALLTIAPRAGQPRTWPIYSPISGTILKCARESERVVAPGEPLVEVGDVARLEVVTDLLSRDAARVRAGQRAIIDAWGGSAIQGRVRRVEPSGFTKVSPLGIEEQRVNVVMDLDALDEGCELGDGYRVDVKIVVAERPNVMMLPLGAIFRDGDAWAVFAIRDDRALKARVELGLRSASDVEVVSGLDEGARVVLYPSDAVRDGVRVTSHEQARGQSSGGR